MNEYLTGDKMEIKPKDMININVTKIKSKERRDSSNKRKSKKLCIINKSNSNDVITNGITDVTSHDTTHGITDGTTDGTTDESVTHLQLNYKPKLFLRCHCRLNDPFDNTTSIWSASFRPMSDESDGNRYVATCGANMVCIIDCEKTDESFTTTNTVIDRYIDDNNDEEFVSLAWNPMPFNCDQNCPQNDNQIVLAVGGKRDIMLFVMNLNNFNRIPNAHSDQINALVFNEKSQLFSGSYDKMIKIWNICSSNEEIVTEMWKCVDTNNQLLSLCFSFKYNAIIGSGMKGITIWPNIYGDKDPVLGFIKTQRLVDGIHTFPEDDDSFAARVYDSTAITVFDLKKAIEEIKSSNTSKIKLILLSNIKKARLESFEKGFPYIYLSVQKNLLASGGPNGKIFLYKTDRFQDYYNSKIEGKADRIIEWPQVEKIKKDGKMIIDDKKLVIVNTVAISPNLKYLIGCTNMNLICIWHQI